MAPARPSAAASPAGVQMQGYYPTVTPSTSLRVHRHYRLAYARSAGVGLFVPKAA